jgi:hypothetical protein
MYGSGSRIQRLKVHYDGAKNPVKTAGGRTPDR